MVLYDDFSVAVIMAATHCGLNYGFWKRFGGRFRKEVRKKEAGGAVKVLINFFEGDVLCTGRFV